MRIAAAILLLVLASCSGAELETESYSIGENSFMRTHCSAADPALAASTPDLLPQQGQTDTDRVSRVLEESRSELLAAHDGIDAVVVARNGQVWTSSGAGIRFVESADSLILMTISGDALCPVAPVVWNGVPVAFFRDGFLK